MANIQGSACGKTSPEHSRLTRARTSEQSLKACAGSRTKPFLFLDMRNGQPQERYWQTVSPLPGECLMLNLHATFTKGTIEFRLFQFDAPSSGKQNGLHAGQLKSYIQLCLALSQLAKQVKTASANPQQTENPKYAMRTWLLRLGFIGDEFKTARELYTKRLEGDTAFRNGRPQ